MAIEEATGAIQHNVHDTFKDVSSTSHQVSSSIGDVQTGGIFGGRVLSFGADFAGMDSKNLARFNSAVDQYRESVNDIIAGLETKRGIIEQAVKGEVAERVQDFFVSLKNLLQTYVSAINTEKKLVEEANNNWLQAASKVAGNISSDADAIRSAAGNINIS